MSTSQKIIKNVAIAFAIFLIVTIFSSILTGIYAITHIFGKNNIGELKTYEVESFQNLDIDIKYTNINIKQGDKCIVETNNSDIEIKSLNNTLKISENKHNIFKNNTGELTIYVPANLEETKINNGSGTLYIENLMTNKLNLNLGVGETVIDNIETNSAYIDTGLGSFKINNGKLNNLDFDMGIGETIITSFISGNSNLDTGIGNLELNLIGDDYKLKINKGIGKVTIDNQEISDKEVVGNGSNNISISGGIGEIKIYKK